jgi:hypothetical protein
VKQKKGGARLDPDSSERHHKVVLTAQTNKKRFS